MGAADDQLLEEHTASLREVEHLLQDDADNADAVQLRDELLQSMSVLRNAAARASAANGAVAPLTDTCATGNAAPVGALIGPALPPNASLHELPNSASATADTTAAADPSPQQAPAADSAATAADQHQQSDQQQPAAKRRRVTAPGSGNARMHPANCYADEEPDFAALASRHPALAQHVHIRQDGSGAVNFANADASRAVTAALLAEHYGVAWSVAPGQLIPPVPGRANYIAWLADLLALSSPPGQVVGLDIGCGANLIYPLLGAAQHGWRFVGADITDVANAGAHANLAANPHLAPLIEVRDVREQPADAANGTAAAAVAADSGRMQGPAASNAAMPDGSDAFPNSVLRPAMRPGERFAFCMTNPPFFESIEQAGLNPQTAHMGTAEEMVCPGGEAAFVGAMVADSLLLRDRIHWYTAMLGRKASLKALRTALYRHRPTALRTTEFAQGRTSRWGLAWSFAVDRNLATQPLVRQPRPQQLAVPPPL